MTAGTKTKLSISLSPDLLERIDRAVARGEAASRSGVIESWLRGAAHARVAAALDEATIRYYEGQTELDRGEDEAWADLATTELGRLDVG